MLNDIWIPDWLYKAWPWLILSMSMGYMFGPEKKSSFTVFASVSLFFYFIYIIFTRKD